MSNKGEGSGRKETFNVLSYYSSVSLPPSLSPRLSDKVLSSGVGRCRKTPPAEPHTKTLSLSLSLSLSLCLFSLPSSLYFTHTRAPTDTHTACGADAGLGPWPWLVLGLLEKDRKRDGERSWEQWWWLVPGLRGLQAVLGNLC